MKIAICISGFIRTWKYTKKSFLEQLYKNADIDVFIHTYYQNQHGKGSTETDELLTDKDFTELFKGVNVVSLSIENRNDIIPLLKSEISAFSNIKIDHKSYIEKDSLSATLWHYDHLRKIHACDLDRQKYALEKNINYDLIVRTRFDIMYFNSIDWNSVDKNKFNIEFGGCLGYPSDIFCVCSPELMTIYAGRILWANNYIFDDGVAHRSILYIMEKYNIQIEYIINTLLIR
jgi:hypothetical protein